MNTPTARAISVVFVIAGLAFLTLPTYAADAGSAKGSLSITIDGPPSHVEIAHAYLVTGADSLAPTKVTRRVIFTVTDVSPMIEACADADCAMYSIEQGMWIQLDDPTTLSWHAQIKPNQVGGMTSRGGLVLTTDKPDHLAGTLTLDTMGVKTRIEFDAPLNKAFTAKK